MEEDNELAMDAPLCSLRRFPTGAAAEGSADPKPTPGARLPFYMSDLKSRPVSDRGGVPFFWELKPGEPKSRSSGGVGRLAAAVKPPPGGVSKESCGEQATVSAPSTMPVTSVRTRKAVVFGPAASAGSSSESSRDNAGKVGDEKQNDHQPTRTVGLEEEEDENEDDDAFSDALDTWSRTDSFFMNCSMSGLSGVPDPAKSPNGACAAADLQVRDLMMGRFLPAAKAMVSAPPQYATRKPSVPPQEPASERATKGECRKPSPIPNQRRPDSALKQYVQQRRIRDHYGYNNVKDEEDDDGSVHLTSKGCGFLPHLCVKASFSLLNSVPGVVKNVGRLPSPSRRSPHKSSGQTKAEPSWGLAYKHKTDQGSKNDGRNRLTSQFNQKNNEEVSSSYRKESPHLPPQEGRDFIRIHTGKSESSNIDGFKNDEDYWVITPDHDSRLVSGILRPAFEKHLGIDPIAVPKITNPQLSSFSAAKDSVAGSQNQRTEVSLEKCPSDALQSNVSQFPEPFSSYEPNLAKLGEDKDLNQKFNNTDTCHLDSHCWSKKTVDVLHQPILPLPLPKSPSDSWLSRTLSSVASKHLAPQILQSIQCQPRTQVQVHFINPKEDTSAKTSKEQLPQMLAKPQSPMSGI